MKISKNCGLSLRFTTGTICGFEILSSIIVTWLVILCWVTSDKPSIFVYEAELTDTYITRQMNLEGCVITWSLSILLSLCVWRTISAGALWIAVKKRSPTLVQYWISSKVILVLMSLFVAVTSFTSSPLKPSALLSLVIDLPGSYFIWILFPEIGLMEREIVRSPKQ